MTQVMVTRRRQQSCRPKVILAIRRRASPPRQTDRRGPAIAAALGTLLLLAGCRHDAADATADDEAKPTVTVEVRPVVRTALDETIEVLGTTQPLKHLTARVTTATEGRVAAIRPESDEPLVPCAGPGGCAAFERWNVKLAGLCFSARERQTGRCRANGRS